MSYTYWDGVETGRFQGFMWGFGLGMVFLILVLMAQTR